MAFADSDNYRPETEIALDKSIIKNVSLIMGFLSPYYDDTSKCNLSDSLKLDMKLYEKILLKTRSIIDDYKTLIDDLNSANYQGPCAREQFYNKFKNGFQIKLTELVELTHQISDTKHEDDLMKNLNGLANIGMDTSSVDVINIDRQTPPSIPSSTYASPIAAFSQSFPRLAPTPPAPASSDSACSCSCTCFSWVLSFFCTIQKRTESRQSTDNFTSISP